MYRKTLLFTCLLALFALQSHAQLPGWSYKAPITSTDTSGVARTNFQVRYIFDSQTLIANGMLQPNGGDLRFGDICGTTLYPYWIESGLNTAQTFVWVTLPTLPANGSTDYYMHYGNSTAPDGNDFAATYPAAIRTNGSNHTLTSALTPDFI